MVQAVEQVQPRPWQRVRAEIDLPVPTAVWVLVAHVLTILSPLLLVWAVADQRAFVDEVFERPVLLYASAVVLIVASVCESAQNTLDRWYLTGVPPSVLDWLFTSLVGLALGLNVLAVYGDTGWMWWAVGAVVALLAVVYLTGGPKEALQMVLGVASVGALYAATRDPVIVLTLLTVFLTIFFLDVLLRTRQQVMHGFTTLVNAVSVVATVLAINGAATDSRWSWPLTLLVIGAVVALAFAVRPRLLRLPPTPRTVPPLAEDPRFRSA
jgi:hypothetical protein